MGASTTRLIKVEEFRNLSLPEHSRYELRNGEVVELTRPKYKHFELQTRICELLRTKAPGGLVQIEFPFRAKEEYDFRVAGVAWLNAARRSEVDPEDAVHGAPDLVIEILSPSNSMREMFVRERLCLENGGLEFWIVDDEIPEVRVTRRDRITTIYKAGSRIPLTIFRRGDDIGVDEIFDLSH